MTGIQVVSRSSSEALPHAEWLDDLPEGTVYGSLYAAPAGERAAVADSFAAAGLPMHLDVILDRDASGALVHRGIVAAELHELGERHPDSLLEVHVIVLAGAKRAAEGGSEAELHAEVSAVLSIVAAVGAQRAALPADMATDALLTREFREAGGEVWTVLEPGDAPAILPASGVDGALVMLIEPGTRESARPELLDRIPNLAPSVQVSVDGGVNASIARHAIALGAHHVIVGRALLGPEQPEAVRGEQP